MRWLVLGASGQLGSEVELLLDPTSTTCLDRQSLDITDVGAVGFLADIEVDVVINAAAWTAVDAAEEHPQEANAVNHLGPRHVAASLAANPCRPVLIQVSTDYVFGAPPKPRRPWRVDDQPRPLSVYGQTKWRGERAVRTLLPERSYVVRSAWLYGAHGSNFARTVLDHALRRAPMTVVNDQWGQPTWTQDLAHRLVALGERARAGAARPGVYHGTNGGSATWLEFARWVYQLAGSDPRLVTPISTRELNRRAPRPPWSVLGQEGWTDAGLSPLRAWEEALTEALPSLLAAH